MNENENEKKERKRKRCDQLSTYSNALECPVACLLRSHEITDGYIIAYAKTYKSTACHILTALPLVWKLEYLNFLYLEKTKIW